VTDKVWQSRVFLFPLLAKIEREIEAIGRTHQLLQISLFNIFAPGSRSSFVQLSSGLVKQTITFLTTGKDPTPDQLGRPVGLPAVRLHPPAEPPDPPFKKRDWKGYKPETLE
jgi:hypothetical protein